MWHFYGKLANCLPLCFRHPNRIFLSNGKHPWFVLLFGKICFNQSEGTTQIWVVTRHQYGISVFVVQMSFRRKIGGCVAKCLAVFSGETRMLNFLFPRFMETVHIAQDIVFLPFRIQPPKNIGNI